jgi:hypothetical protein
MKVVAISQRGDKKDFFDLYEIFKTVSPHDLKLLFLKKFGASRINSFSQECMIAHHYCPVNFECTTITI